MIPDLEIILRLLVAAGLGAVIGLERERQNQPAGLRTHIILVVGSALAMTLSINIAVSYHLQGLSADPSHLAAQVISGIGFLGAGAILRYGANVKGLSTAASVWSMAVVGLAVGGGYYLPAAAATVLLLVCLEVLNFLEHRVIRSYITMQVTLVLEDRPHLLEEARQTMLKHVKKVAYTQIDKDIQKNQAEITAEITFLEGAALEKLMDDLAQIKGVRRFKIL